jgi:hypothetical protein
VLGYLSGANVWARGIAGNPVGGDRLSAQLEVIPVRSVVLWMKNYCREHPLERVEVGVQALVIELAKPTPEQSFGAAPVPPTPAPAPAANPYHKL